MTPPAVSAMFPCYNDEATIGGLVDDVHRALAPLVSDLEVIVVNDGSADGSRAVLDELAATRPWLRPIHHEVNRGYGGALITGFTAARFDWIFYTDGDAQYDPGEVTELWKALTDDVDWVNGWKISRSDPLHRIIIGRIYHHTVKTLFGLTVRDVKLLFAPPANYHLIELGPKSATYKGAPGTDPSRWTEIFSPDLDCTVRNVSITGVRTKDSQADLPIEQVVKVIEQKLNPDYPKTTPKGGTGKAIWIR